MFLSRGVPLINGIAHCQLITLPVYLINLSVTRVASGVYILDVVNYVNYINLVSFGIVYSKIDMKLTIIDN